MITRINFVRTSIQSTTKNMKTVSIQALKESFNNFFSLKDKENCVAQRFLKKKWIGKCYYLTFRVKTDLTLSCTHLALHNVFSSCIPGVFWIYFGYLLVPWPYLILFFLVFKNKLIIFYTSKVLSVQVKLKLTTLFFR